VLLYLLGIPALVPVFLAAYAVVGERQQGTLEPVLTTPIRREELLLGKAIAAVLPSLVVAYAVFALFLACIELFAQPTVASALIQVPDLIAQVVFTPLLAVWSIWVGIAISARSSDIRVAQQLSVLASLPAVLLVVLVALNVIPPTPGLALGLAVVLLVLDGLGWRITSRLFDRERLVIGSQ
jgi:ABC-2 type transport system permease protein